MPACLFLEDLGSLESNDVRMWSHPEGETSFRGNLQHRRDYGCDCPSAGSPTRKLLRAPAVGGANSDEENLCVKKRFLRPSHLFDSTNCPAH